MVAYSAGPLSTSSIDHASLLGLTGGKSHYPLIIKGANLPTAGDERKPLKDINSPEGNPKTPLTSLTCQRKDGRRSIELEKVPSLAKTSPLYGRPSWWGEDCSHGSHSDSEISPMKASSCILRDLGPKLISQSNTGSSSQPYSREQDPLASQAKSSSPGTLMDAVAHTKPSGEREKEGMLFNVELEAAKKQKPAALKSHRSKRASSARDSAGDVLMVDQNTISISSRAATGAKEKRSLPAPSNHRLMKGGSPCISLQVV